MYEEEIAIIAHIIGVDVIILDAYTDKLSTVFTTYDGSSKGKIALISRISNNDVPHYDLIGHLTDDGIATIFNTRDKLVTNMLDGIELRKKVSDKTIDYYRYAIIKRLNRFSPPNKDGYVMFEEFSRLDHDEPYYT